MSPLLAVSLALAAATPAPTLDDAHVRVRTERAPGAELLRGGDIPAVLLFGPGCGGTKRRSARGARRPAPVFRER